MRWAHVLWLKHVKLLHDNVVLNKELAVLFVRAIVFKCPPGNDSLFVERAKKRLLDGVGDGHVIFNRVQSTEYEIEYTYLEKRRLERIRETTESWTTHRSRQVAFQLFDDSCEASPGRFQKIPTASHALPIPTRRGMLLPSCDIALLLVEEIELDQSTELERVR